MSISYLVGRFASGLAPGTVPAPAPVNGYVTMRYSHLLQVNATPGTLIPVTPVRLAIVDGVLVGPDGVPSTTAPIPVQATDDPALAQTGSVFAQLDIVFDGGSEPVQALLELPADVTVDIATAARAGTGGAVFVSGLTPSQLVELDEGLAQVAEDRAASQTARDAAETAAAEAVAISTEGIDPATAALVPNLGSQLGAALDARFARDHAFTVDVTKAAPTLDLTGAVDGSAAWDAMIAAAPAGSRIMVPPGASIRFASARTLAKRVHVDGRGATFRTTANAGIFKLTGAGSGSTFTGIHFQGVNPTTFADAGKAIELAGTPTSWVDGVHLEDCTFDGFGYGGVFGSHVSNFAARDCRVTNCVYAGFQFLSPRNCVLWNPLVDGLFGITATGYQQSYPIAWTRDHKKTSITDYPNAADCTTWGGLIQNTGWEGVDTHGGTNIRTIGVTIRGCQNGVAYVPCPDPTNTIDLYAPDGLIAYCTIESGVTDGSKGPGIKLVGCGSFTGRTMAATGKIIGNTVRGHGAGKLPDGSNADPSNLSGAIQLYETDGALIDGNTIIEPSPFGIVLYYSNTNLQIGPNHVVDAWSDTFTLPAAVGIRSLNNDVQLGAVRLSRGTKTATNVNRVGLYLSQTTQNFVNLTGGEDFNAADQPFTSLTGRIRESAGIAQAGSGPTIPNCNTWARGSRWWNSDVAAGASPGWVCTTAGGAYAGTWTASTAVSAGTWYRTSTGKILECVVAGTTSTTQPNPTVIGSRLTDGGATFIYRSATSAVFKAMPALAA